MKPGLYHKRFGIPSQVGKWCGRWPLAATRHAMTEALRDRHQVDLPKEVSFSLEDVFEALIDACGRVEKIGVRVKYNSDFDVVLILKRDRFDSRKLLVITIWTNDAGDEHKTLNGAKYNQCNLMTLLDKCRQKRNLTCA